ncbi:UDP-N-acetylmuramoyl-L-alanyl-D-glutamate--2,6-diaminopimelate ligase [bacterium]|nr:UDP-N-acetylmuramoyl-L-alanyl-D-glutamate--2,6-diaminopimelate ligase [bacterium]
MTAKKKKNSEIVSYLKQVGEYIDSNITSERDVSNVISNSMKCEDDVAFVCYQGTSRDLHDFIPNAISNHTPLVILENPSISKNLSSDINWILVDNARASWAYACSFIQDHPGDHLKITGITGTNGKSSTVFIAGAVFKGVGKKTMTIGTLGFDIDGEKFESAHTTPDPNVLYPLLNKAVVSNVEFVFMEVSSHAIVQEKTAPLKFDAYGFTSFSQDHLDFHSSMTEYFEAKCRPLENNMKENAFFILNQNVHKQYADALKNQYSHTLTKIIGKGSGFASYSFNGNDLVLETEEGKIAFNTPYIGEYANENLLMSLVLASKLLGMPYAKLVKHVDRIPQIPGRLEIVSQKPLVIVDYAHTPDALSNVLKTISLNHPGNITTVFGCGGDRDKGKRPKMAKAAEEYSAKIVVTSDNPRTESATEIIDDILTGFSNETKNGGGLDVELDREAAIKLAIKQANLDLEASKSQNPIVLIAGKGHEDYQIIGTTKSSFDDRVIAKKYI